MATQAQREAWPAWRVAMADRTWAELPGNTLADCDPGPGVWSGNAGFEGIVTAWNGAAWRDDTAEMGIYLAGGHWSYYGNEGYKASLLSDVPTWERIGLPNGAPGAPPFQHHAATELSYIFDDGHQRPDGGVGRPQSPHTMHYPLWCPADGSWLLCGGTFPGQTGHGKRRVWQWHPESGEYSLRASHANQDGNEEVGAVYDRNRGVVWVMSSSGGPGVSKFDPATNTYETARAGAYYSWGVLVGYSPVLDCLIRVYGSQLYVQRIVDGVPNWQFEAATVEGAPPAVADCSGGSLTYSDERDRWYLVTDANVVLELEPPAALGGTWTWHTIADAGAYVPRPPVQQGRFGRTVWSDSLEAIVKVETTGARFEAFAIDGSGTPPPPPPPPPPEPDPITDPSVVVTWDGGEVTVHQGTDAATVEVAGTMRTP